MATSGSSLSESSFEYLDWDLPTAACKVAEGLPTYALERVREKLSVSRKEFSDIIQISERTMSRRAKERSLPVDESERVYRLSRLMELAVRVLGSEDDARDWMKESNVALGDATPLAFLRTEPGAELVEQVLGRIEHGIPV